MFAAAAINVTSAIAAAAIGEELVIIIVVLRSKVEAGYLGYVIDG